MYKRSSIFALPLLCVALGACDEATRPASAALTAAEASALAAAVDNGSSASVDPQADEPSFSLSPSAGPTLAVTTRTDQFSLDVACPKGGTSTLSGEHVIVIDSEEGFITVDVTASKGHEACVFRTQQGVDITVDGTLQFVAERELRQGLASASQTHSGSLDYSTSEGKSGTCPIDITTSFTLTPGAATRTILGSVCGHDVDLTTSWTHAE